jgi:hypothetical protein
MKLRLPMLVYADTACGTFGDDDRVRRFARMAWRARSAPWSKRICATGSTCAKLTYLHFLRRIAASKALRANE